MDLHILRAFCEEENRELLVMLFDVSFVFVCFLCGFLLHLVNLVGCCIILNQSLHFQLKSFGIADDSTKM